MLRLLIQAYKTAHSAPFHPHKSMNETVQISENKAKHGKIPAWIFEILLVLVLLTGALLRLRGIYWGEFTYMHPDERFLVWVGTDIQPIGTDSAQIGPAPRADQPGMTWRAQYPQELPDCLEWGGYFDAACSPLNPNNRGHSFYVYGTLPMFLTRYVVEWIYGHSGFTEMTKVGRPLSALADLFLIFLVYLTAARLFNRRVAVLAAAFSALAVLQIQQSHFFTMDTFITAFTMLAFYYAVQVSLIRDPEQNDPNDVLNPSNPSQLSFLKQPYFWPSIGFGLALGLAVSSKINAVLVAWTLPAGMVMSLICLPKGKRERWFFQALGSLALSAFLSVLIFRIFQPYAFTGPGFFGLKPNPQWVATLRELMAQGAGDIDFPPSLQWARRSITYSGVNLVLFGLGLPLGLLAWAGFLWAGWRMLRSEWQRMALLWTWTAFYFGWQSMAFNPTMRYQLPVYPTLAIFGAWIVLDIYDRARSGSLPRWFKPAAVGIGTTVLMLTLAWAVGFSNIYAWPFTRIDASRWIYQNVPGPINLIIGTSEGTYSQIVPFPYNGLARTTAPYQVNFTAKASGILGSVFLPHVADKSSAVGTVSLNLTISSLPDGESPVGSALIAVTPVPGGHDYILLPDMPIHLLQDELYYLTLAAPEGSPAIEICGQITPGIQGQIDFTEIAIDIPDQCHATDQSVLSLPFTSSQNGFLTQLVLAQVKEGENNPRQATTIDVRITATNPPGISLVSSLKSSFDPGPDGRGQGYILSFEPGLAVVEGQNYLFELVVQPGGSPLYIEGSAVANEGDWDDGLPLRLDGYDGFGSIYTPGLNFNMYTDDNQDKLTRFETILDQTEYIFISSNRQWGSLPRLPERFPLSTLYYRELLGCPEENTIFWCYAVAEPGMFQGSLGFELAFISQSNPAIGSLAINDQFAEEAFHVYDHPKVLIFRKTAAYDPEIARAILGSADLDHVVRITPKKAGPFPANLLLPEERLNEQTKGGTWSESFNPEALQNKFPVLGVVVWYAFIWLLGILVYPALHLAMPGLSDRGYPLARVLGMLVLAYLVWVAGSARIPFNRATISAALLIMAVAAGFLAYIQRDELRTEWVEKRRYFLMIEGLALGFFILFLLVRLGNPDLWHPWKGGEKPMDFAYFNAVLKSTSFPPYDPWFAGGTLNYYYYGFVLVGVPVKFLGIVPAFAYNLILPTMFSLTAMGAFSAVWNLVRRSRFFPALAASFGMAILGNLGTLRMILRGYQIVVDSRFAQEGPNLFERIRATFQGFTMVLAGANLPYGIGDWYWIPSRVMPPGDNAITEMPAFTFLYADPHAHMFALPLTLLCLVGILAVVLGRARWRSSGAALLSLSILALAIGALWPTNTWDFPTYLALGIVAVGYTFWRYLPVTQDTFRSNRLLNPLAQLPVLTKRLLLTISPVILLVVLANILYTPYYQWYGQGYSSIEAWKGPITPLSSYFTHWGLFLFILVGWLVWESVDWMSKTPLSSARKLDGYWEIIYILLALLLVMVAVLVIKVPLPDSMTTGQLGLARSVVVGILIQPVIIALLALPLAAWAGVLLLRPGQTDAKRVVLFMTGTAFVITLVVEVIVLKGDIGRQNTVFKLYLQAWTLFAISAAAALGWIFKSFSRWASGWRHSFQFGLILLAGITALFPILGGTAKIRDRMAVEAPHTLDGMAYMQYAEYNESGTIMDLNQDYQLIRWMQNTIQGSPVIVEANSGNLYRWYSRITINTGLPGVVGWEWHQQQQRALTPPDWVSTRLREINAFYESTSTELAANFLQKYNVEYVVVGQLERITYAGPGLDKFDTLNGELWQEIYRQQDTVLYKVTKP